MYIKAVIQAVLIDCQDSQLWFDDADCLVHFYGYQFSQRGPSLKIPFEAVERLNCRYLLEDCLHSSGTISANSSPTSKTESGYGSLLSTISELEKSTYELYIPTPPSLPREEAFSYHMTTRNVLAYAVGRPVVGERLSSALTALWRRLREWLPGSASLSDFTDYLQKQGYLQFAENAEHALACLKFAENAKARDVWIDSFVHCVGMHERLFLSPEFAGLSNTTNALITRASLEMDLHIARIVRALGSFLEEELGTEHLGLSKPARDHLDHFRSFLHAFYVDKLGYFPPRESTPWQKRPWKAMYQDFQSLYDYLVDTDSSYDRTSTRALTGGICVIQNVQAFDQRHGYEPLSHPLPLLPKAPARQRRSMSSQKALRSFKLGSQNSIPEPKLTKNQALAIATNCLKGEVMLCPLVQEYQRFERQKLEPKLDAKEARKVRWLLIYSVLQMLTSIMRAPKEVRDTDTPSYALCVLTTGCPPWMEDESDTEDIAEEVPQSSPSATLLTRTLDALEGRSPSRISIHPDCEADSAEDFFATNTISRRESQMDLKMTPPPLRVNTQLSRTATIRSSMQSSVQALHKSVVGSLSRRNSIRRESLPLAPRKIPSHCEIVVEYFGNGVNDNDVHEEAEDTRPQTAFHPVGDTPTTEVNGAFSDFDFDLAAVNGEQTLGQDQIDRQFDQIGFVVGAADDDDRSPRESHCSAASGDLLNSNRSSYQPDSDSGETDPSSVDGDSCKGDAENSAPSTPVDLAYDIHTPRQLCYRPSNPKLGAKSVAVSIHGGCYIPTGMVVAPISRFHQRTLSGDSVLSAASSTYPEESVQAADIEEVEERGRRRSRALDKLSQRNFVAAA